jgi:TM2 domain-containing membrane protein YozV
MAGKGQKGGGMNTGNAGVGGVGGVGPVTSGPIGGFANPMAIPRCSRLVYIVLAIFLGWLGIHNFVAGYSNRGAWQLALGLIGLILSPCTFGISSVLILAGVVWSIVDIVQTTTDADGVRLN